MDRRITEGFTMGLQTPEDEGIYYTILAEFARCKRKHKALPTFLLMTHEAYAELVKCPEANGEIKISRGLARLRGIPVYRSTDLGSNIKLLLGEPDSATD